MNSDFQVDLSLLKGDFHLDVKVGLPSKGVIAIWGESGCGKTSLLRSICGLEKEAEGRLNLAGEIWLDEKKYVPVHQRKIGYVFQDARLFEHLSVIKNIEYGRKRSKIKMDDKELLAIQKVLGLEDLLDRGVKELSGGEKQRVAIARALAIKPDLLLLDEPLSGLDLNRKKEIYPYLDRMKETLAIPIIYVSHDLDELTRLSDYMVLLNQGRVTASGSLVDMLTRLDLGLAKSKEAESVLNGRIEAHDLEYGLTKLNVSGGEVWVPRLDRALGEAVKVRLRAQDVSLSLEKQTGTSISNVIHGVIKEIEPMNDSQVVIKLAVGTDFILSHITKKSLCELKLERDMELFIQVKGVAVLT